MAALRLGLSVLLSTTAALACSSSPGGDGSGSCPAFDCERLAECSSLPVDPCNELCDCYPQRWRTGAFETFAACVSSCDATGDRYDTCFVQTSSAQPAFADAQYTANCDAKRSVCPGYPQRACDPVHLRLLSDASRAELKECLGLPCDGQAKACADDVLSCSLPEP